MRFVPSRLRALPRRGAGESRRPRGQSVTELALILPVMVLLLLFTLDFGRIYLGWINLQQMARIGANFAANNATAWATPGDPAKQARFRELIENDARAINCTVPDPLPDPVFSAGYDLGDPVRVTIPCQFAVLTPVIDRVLGGTVLLSAGATFPVKQGAVGTVPGGGGGPITLAPDADFTGSPQSGYAPLDVSFFDLSANAPTSWVWSFGDGNSSFQQNPEHTYATPGTYTVRLTASNGGGTDAEVRTDYITVLEPPAAGPIPEFDAAPRAGEPGLVVSFTDRSTGSPTSWLWDFGDGGTSTSRNPSHTYTSVGSFDVSLTVSDGTTSNTQTKNGLIVITQRPCEVPNFAGERKNDAQDIWRTARFTTTVTFRQGTGNYRINFQSLPGGLVDPPGGCNATIEVGP